MKSECNEQNVETKVHSVVKVLPINRIRKRVQKLVIVQIIITRRISINCTCHVCETLLPVWNLWEQTMFGKPRRRPLDMAKRLPLFQIRKLILINWKAQET